MSDPESVHDIRPSTVLSTPMTRRQLLQGSVVAGLGAFLAACQAAASPSASPTAPPTETAGASATPAVTETPAPSPTGPLNFANWPGYMNYEADGVTSPTLKDFEAKYGIAVNYQEKIEDNVDFVATVNDQLKAGIDTGWDLMVLTDWLAAKLIGRGWIEKIDQGNVPNAVKNLREKLRGKEWDSKQEYHYPWQSGGTGVGYNKTKTKRALTKLADLFDPAFKGKVTMLTEMRDTIPLVGLYLMSQGKLSNPPEKLTVDDAKVIHDFLKPYVESGHIKAFTTNEYLQDFGSGNTWVAMVWSGDLASSGGPDDVYAYPEEGSMLWTDNALIPRGTQHKLAAELMINWVYDIDIAARLTGGIYYFSPVEGVLDKLTASDPDKANNPLIFPTPAVVAKQHEMRALNEEDETQFNELFADLTGE